MKVDCLLPRVDQRHALNSRESAVTSKGLNRAMNMAVKESGGGGNKGYTHTYLLDDLTTYYLLLNYLTT